MEKAHCVVSLPWFMCRCEHVVGSVLFPGRYWITRLFVARRVLQVAWGASRLGVARGKTTYDEG